MSLGPKHPIYPQFATSYDNAQCREIITIRYWYERIFFKVTCEGI